MFTVEQIKTAHSKVKSGADFPAYIREIKQLGVVSYQTYVADGHTDYEGHNDFKAKGPAKYALLSIAGVCNEAQFKSDLSAHQRGKSDYPTFCNQCAQSGIEKWRVSIEEMTCTYFDKAGNLVLVEEIPS
ncbi:MAG TPA: DUF1398 family protein [Cyclobacteriaceae bacterium]|nr:DUF1398 family protein [Cyclobacteriaceae bacterium]